MKGISPNLFVALAILWPGYLPASDVTNASSEPAEFISEVIPIKYAKATELAALLSATNKVAQPFFIRLGKRLTQKIGGDAIQCQLEKMGSRQIVAEERSNSLLICAVKHDLIALKEIIARLDFVLPQILIDGVIMEFPICDTNAKHRVEVQPRPGLVALKYAGLVVDTTFPFQTTNGLAHAINDGSYLATSRAGIDETLTAMASNSRTRILYRPRVQTSEGEPAQFFIGASTPYPRPSYYAGGDFGQYSSIQSVNEGMTLEITCSLQTNNLIQLEINKTIERANGSVNIANVGTVPITTREDKRAQIVVCQGAVFVIGGFLQTNKVPRFSESALLGHIPGGRYLNKLITYPKRKTRSELVLLMRAILLPTPELAAVRSKDAMPRPRPPEPEVPRNL
jgi:type II secretory pathway component GspD/PulD (secretin)